MSSNGNACPPEVVALVEEFKVSREQQYGIMDKLEEEINKGLSAELNPAAELKMLPTYVTALPDGTEDGDFLALDLGGSNFRVLWVKIQNGQSKTRLDTYTIPSDVMLGPGDQLFDYIAERLGHFTKSIGDVQIPLGFTFSFPCHHNGLASATLVEWTKGFKASGVEGEDVVALLQAACKRKNVRVDVVALLNDTVATQMAGAFKDQNCFVGLIIGTGCNASYMEKSGRVELFDGKKGPDDYVLIDCEWGGFGDNGSLDNVRNDIDRNLDKRTVNPGDQLYEKMFSGMYIGEVLRLTLVHLIDRKILFGGHAGSFKKEWDFQSKNVTLIENDSTEDLSKTRDILESCDVSPSAEDLQIVRTVNRAIWRRGAKLVASNIAQLARRINRPNLTVAVDGSMYTHFPQFRELMMSQIDELVPDYKVKFLHAEDGGGVGGAITAAVAARLLQQNGHGVSNNGVIQNGAC